MYDFVEGRMDESISAKRKYKMTDVNLQISKQIIQNNHEYHKYMITTQRIHKLNLHSLKQIVQKNLEYQNNRDIQSICKELTKLISTVE